MNDQKQFLINVSIYRQGKDHADAFSFFSYFLQDPKK